MAEGGQILKFKVLFSSCPKARQLRVLADNVGLEYWILRYELTPRTPQAGGCFSFGPPLYPGDTTTCNWAEDTFKRALGNNHYVFVGSGLQSLRKAYPSVFDETTSTGNSAILKVIQDAQGIITLRKWRGEPR